jgi:hypothetical protein
MNQGSIKMFPVISCLLDPNIFVITLFLNTLTLCASLHVTDQVSHPYKTTIRIIFLDIFIFKSECNFIKQGFPVAVNAGGKNGKNAHTMFSTDHSSTANIC